MKKFLLILLLVMLPFQSCWSAASAYCQHEAGKGAAHLGHHFHQHRGDAKADGSKAKGSIGHTDADCGFCHSGVPAPLLSAMPPILIPLVATHAEPQPVFFTSHIPEGLMRPDWRLVA